jgi:hypothetical protein
MASPQPSRPADHTRPLEPFSPTLGHRPRKTNRKSTISPAAIPYGGAQRTISTVTNALQQGIESTVTEATLTEKLLKDFAASFDGFAASYDTQQQQVIAKEILEAVAGTLVQFYQNKYGAGRAAPPTATVHASQRVSYAEKLQQKAPRNPHLQGTKNQQKVAPAKLPPKSREDFRVLVTIDSQQTLQREDSYILKRRLLNEFPTVSSNLIKTITPTMTG